MKLTKCFFSRKSAELDTNNLYVFNDNCDRTSGNGKISDDSEYSKRFGKTGLRYSNSFIDSVRGLPNAYPITTKKNKERSWKDSDFEEFKQVIDDDFEHIKKACVENGYKKIIFPSNGIINFSKTNLSYKTTPKLYIYIVKKEIELAKFEP